MSEASRERRIPTLGSADNRGIGHELRRVKTGIDRYGDTPPGVWSAIEVYLAEIPRPEGEFMFVTKNEKPVVHVRSDGLQPWWQRLREAVGDSKDSLGGFSTFRHLGATESGLEKGCSIVVTKRRLGHSSCSRMAEWSTKTGIA